MAEETCFLFRLVGVEELLAASVAACFCSRLCLDSDSFGQVAILLPALCRRRVHSVCLFVSAIDGGIDGVVVFELLMLALMAPIFELLMLDF